MYFISQFFLENMHDCGECLAAIMPLQIFDVFQEENRRPMMFDNVCQIIKQSALCITQKAMRFTQGVLFGNSGNRKRLAGEACEQNIMLWHPCRVFGVWTNIFGKLVLFAVRVVRSVGLSCKAIPLGSKDTLPAQFFKWNPYPTDTCKQINKPEAWLTGGGFGTTLFNRSFQGINDESRSFLFGSVCFFITSNCSRGPAYQLRCFVNGKSCLLAQGKEAACICHGTSRWVFF
ncbi:hypothetical protein A9D60_23465 [Leisingera sp. JC1]|nr:hypothetical protein A9D60_23465 [Leisingera sp. JC1]